MVLILATVYLKGWSFDSCHALFSVFDFGLLIKSISRVIYFLIEPLYKLWVITRAPKVHISPAFPLLF